jgi:hypothetical protein
VPKPHPCPQLIKNETNNSDGEQAEVTVPVINTQGKIVVHLLCKQLLNTDK